MSWAVCGDQRSGNFRRCAVITFRCWHRPGRVIGNTAGREITTCRFCGVAIEWCPCAGEFYRKVDPDCRLCGGSTWVATVRSERAKFAEYIAEFLIEAVGL